jgi:hypothetical protein
MTGGTRCRRVPRPAPAAGSLRPSDLLAVFFAAGIGFLLAGAVVAAVSAATGWEHGHWLALHLVFVGGISQLVLGAGQFFAGAFLATDPPARWLVRLQLATWNAGTLLVAAGVPGDVAVATIAGAVLLAAGLAGFLLCANLIASLRATSAGLSLPVRLLTLAQGCLVLGLAVALADALTGSALASPLASTRMALAALLLPGWLGLTVLGSLLHLLAVLARVRDFRQPLPATEPARDGSFVAIAAGGVVGLAVARTQDLALLNAAATGALLASYGALGALVLSRAARALRARPPGSRLR